MYDELYDHQKEGVEFLVERTHAYLAYRMRLGKTPTAIVAADQVFAQSILTVCKATAKPNWAREFAKWQQTKRTIGIVGKASDGVPNTDVVIVNYDMVHVDKIKKALNARQWDISIPDEAQYLKNHKAKRTKALLGPHANGNGIFANSERMWALSGTPMLNAPIDLWAILHSCFPRHITPKGHRKPLKYWDFARTFCELYETDFGVKIGGGKNLDKLGRILDRMMLIKQTVPGLPPHRYGEITLDPEDPKVLSSLTSLPHYEDLEEAIRVGRDFTDCDFELATLREHLAVIKAPLLAQMIKDEFEEGLSKVVIFAHHTRPIEILKKAFGDAAAMVHGGVTKRQPEIDRFQNDPECKVFIGQIQAAGDSITLDASTDIVFLEQDWVPAMNEQAAARCDNFRDDRSVMVRVCMLADSVDEHVQRTLARKNSVIKQVIKE